jgi:hypothetical protein
MCYAAATATVTLRAFSPFVRRPSPAECIALVRLYPEVIAREILVPNLLPFPPTTSVLSSYFSMHPSARNYLNVESSLLSPLFRERWNPRGSSIS